MTDHAAEREVLVIERFQEAPWFKASGWYWSVANGGSGVARTKQIATDRAHAELARLGLTPTTPNQEQP